MKTALNNVVLPTLFNIVNNIVQQCHTWLRANSGSTMLNNTVDNIEQCGQHNIVQGCFHQPWTGCAFFAVYKSRNTHKHFSFHVIEHYLLMRFTTKWKPSLTSCDWASAFSHYLLSSTKEPGKELVIRYINAKNASYLKSSPLISYGHFGVWKWVVVPQLPRILY